MAKKVKTKKKLKKLIARARMKRVQKIMNAVRIHQENHRKTQGEQNKPAINQDLANKILARKAKALQNKISSSRRRSRRRWRNR